MNDRSAASTPGQRFRAALSEAQPLPIVGTINPYCAMMAERVGRKAIYLAGGGIATYSHGLPDLAITTLNDVLEDVRRITDAMAAAALKVYQAILRDGSVKNVMDLMQTRDELYDFLDYHAYEQKLDRLFAKQR